VSRGPEGGLDEVLHVRIHAMFELDGLIVQTLTVLDNFVPAFVQLVAQLGDRVRGAVLLRLDRLSQVIERFGALMRGLLKPVLCVLDHLLCMMHLRLDLVPFRFERLMRVCDVGVEGLHPVHDSVGLVRQLLRRESNASWALCT